MESNMGDSLITVVAIFLAAVLMFVFPLMAVSERTDDIAELSAQTATAEFVDNIRATGKLSLADYDQFVQEINSSGNSYEIDIQVMVKDENIGIKVTQEDKDKIGENEYYNVYTTQILDALQEKYQELEGQNVLSPEEKARITLKEGDIVSVKVKNTNVTISQLLRNFLYHVTGDDTYQIAAEAAGIVTVNGK